MKLVFATILLLITSIISISASTVSAREIYLVRHAEKQTGTGKDPALTEKGHVRAANLIRYLKSKNISAVYSTNYKRTLQTAEPLAKMLDIKIKIYDPRKLEAFAGKLKAGSGNALVVGHSNTTPELVILLGGDDHGKIDESEYERVYLLQINGDNAQSQLLKLE